MATRLATDHAAKTMPGWKGPRRLVVAVRDFNNTDDVFTFDHAFAFQDLIMNTLAFETGHAFTRLLDHALEDAHVFEFAHAFAIICPCSYIASYLILPMHLQ